MVFSSLSFIYIFLLILISTHAFCHGTRARNWLLLGFSLCFYAWGEPIWIIVMLLESVIAWSFTALINREAERLEADLPETQHLQINQYPPLVHFYLTFAIGSCIAFLLIFKYSAFFADCINTIPFIQIPRPNLRLPIGISFYTFQIITYVVDVYRRDAKVQRNYFNFLLYVSLFPQLIAGPIVRYADIDAQIRQRFISSEKVVSGIQRFLVGLAKKTLIANYAGQIVHQSLETRLSQLTGLEALIGLLAYTAQIYFDFSAYSDMAIGLGRIFGFDFLENFNYPYISKSITEFWRRWHMSLSTFFRDYVYIPLGGRYRHQLRNIFIVWLLTGFWHGASVNFILWGLYYAILLCIEKYLLKDILPKIPSLIRHTATMILVCLGWIFFYFTDFSRMGEFFHVLFSANGFSNALAIASIRSQLVFLLLAAIAATPLPKQTFKTISQFVWRKYGSIEDPQKQLFKDREDARFGKTYLLATERAYDHRAAQIQFVYILISNLLLLLLSTAALVSASYNPFLYFRF
ncbi:MAG: MBOAT family O-acyltransferase [Eubacteriales bacterium]|nr:MBOAT family O-acyltransferase [Eubacteriales bacterium]